GAGLVGRGGVKCRRRHRVWQAAAMEIRGSVSVITGGASGIGLETARLLAAAGSRLVLADIEQGALDRAQAELGAITDVLGVVTDVADKDSVDALADATYDRFGQADVVFGNAGVAVGGPILDMTHADWKWII